MGRVRDRIGDKRVLALGQGVLQGRHPHRGRQAWQDTTPAPRKAASCRRCWPTSRCLCSTTTSPRPGRRWGTPARGTGAAAEASRPTGSSATRTTSWSWSTAPKRTPKHYAIRRQPSLPRWACACRRQRPGSATSTRASTSSASASSGSRNEAAGNRPSTPTRPRRRSTRSPPRCETITRQGHNHPLAVLLHRLAPVLRGWTNYFRHGVSKATFDYLRRFTWRRVLLWIRRKHRHVSWKWLRRRYLPGWWPTDGDVTCSTPAK